jgi:hypothetical protein
MTTKFLTGGALAAFAAALALTAVPAFAQDWHHGHDRDGQQEKHDNHQSGDRHQNRSEASRGGWGNGPSQRANTPAAEVSRGQWTDRHVDRHDDTPARAETTGRLVGWGDGRQGTVGGRGYTEQGRNTTYVDPNRNQTYVDRNREAYRYQRDNNRDWRSDRRDNDRDWRDRRDGGRTYRDARGSYQQWNRTWRNNDRYDWQRYRTHNRNIYHLRPYYSPYRGYSYRRLGIGFYLQPLFFSQNYWISDPWYYRLPDVYGPYRWVRYYDDALLVNVYTGEVVDVIYDFFW